eukprot:11858575-Alexandrium_andersonii.AAC.1
MLVARQLRSLVPSSIHASLCRSPQRLAVIRIDVRTRAVARLLAFASHCCSSVGRRGTCGQGGQGRGS